MPDLAGVSIAAVVQPEQRSAALQQGGEPSSVVRSDASPADQSQYLDELMKPAAGNGGPDTAVVTGRSSSREIPHEISHGVPQKIGEDPVLPDLRIDLGSATARLPKPTVMNVPASVMARFARMRRDADSHTGVTLDALRATVGRLPELVATARPQPQAGDLFPLRGGAQRERRDPLRVRPTVAELAVIDRIVQWVAEEIDRRYPGSPRVTRSEVVSAALDAYLPGRRSHA